MGTRRSKVVAFPWERLPRLSRGEAEWRREARRSVGDLLSVERAAAALSELIGTRVRVEAVRIKAWADAPARLEGSSLSFESSDGRVRAELEVERELVRALVGAVFSEPLGWTESIGPIPAAVEAALAVIAVRVARRAATGPRVLRWLGAGGLRLGAGEHRLVVDGTVQMHDNVYAVRATVPLPLPAPTAFPHADRLAALGAFPIALPIVLGALRVDRAELEACRPGDLLEGFEGLARRPDGALSGNVALLAPSSEIGWLAELSGETLRALAVEPMAWDAETPDCAPAVIVRVEAGQVRWTASQWARLKPGDPIGPVSLPSGPVLLRVAGEIVAQGALVTWDDRLAVRITELLRSAPPAPAPSEARA